MAKSPEGDLTLIKQASSSVIARIIDRAEQQSRRQAKAQAKGLQAALKSRPPRSLLRKVVKSALRTTNRRLKNNASIRVSAPDTGGVPFHFGLSHISKKGTGFKAATNNNGSAKGGPKNSTTTEGAHQNYVERDAAIDSQAIDIREHDSQQVKDLTLALEEARAENGKTPDQQKEDLTQDTQRHPLNITQEKSRLQQELKIEQAERTILTGISTVQAQQIGIASDSSEIDTQKYIENPNKMMTSGTTSSFGTIGTTMADRQKFWELVNQNEAKNARTQMRLVIELPHEANDATRFDIVRRFTQEAFEKKGIPYWAAIHVPTYKNDDRNYHAHIVFTDRPAKKIINPETGQEEWDFAIATKERDSSRHYITKHPYRQNKDRSLSQKDYPKKLRKLYAQTTNIVLANHALPIRYDPRSYKNMGLDIEPMKHIPRIVADKQSSKGYSVLDDEETRKLINRELERAAITRTKHWNQLTAVRKQITASESRNNANRPSLKNILSGNVSPEHIISAAGPAISRQLLQIEQQRLLRDLADQAAIRTLSIITEATKTPIGHETDPEEVARQRIHTAAQEELKAIIAAGKKRNKSISKKLTSTYHAGTPQPDFEGPTSHTDNQRTANSTKRPATAPSQGTRTATNSQKPPQTANAPNNQRPHERDIETVLNNDPISNPKTPAHEIINIKQPPPIDLATLLADRLAALTDSILEDGNVDYPSLTMKIAALAKATAEAQRELRDRLKDEQNATTQKTNQKPRSRSSITGLTVEIDDQYSYEGETDEEIEKRKKKKQQKTATNKPPKPGIER